MGGEVRLTGWAGSSLDAVSLQLPEGTYTTVRTYEGVRILGLASHLQRLVDSQAIVGQGRAMDLAAIRSALRTVLDREALPAARLRLTAPFHGEFIFISVEPFEAYPPECYARGVRCATMVLDRELPKAKRTAFIPLSRAARDEANSHAADIHELLRLDAAGWITEGLSSNFFALLGGKLYTATDGVLEGVTRGVVLQLAAAIVPVVGEAIRLADVPEVSEAFITSSSREIMPVAQIDDQLIGSGLPGPVTRTLLGRYRDSLLRTAEIP